MAAVFDLFDGMVARLLQSTSEIGAELDSLCDAVSFGVAPSFLIYKMYLWTFGEWGMLYASIPVIAAVYRLARFNVQVTSFEDKFFFKGLPVPGAALTIISFTIFFVDNSFISSSIMDVLVMFLVSFLGLMMISSVRFPNFPRPSLTSFKLNPLYYILVLIAVILGIVTKGFSVFPTMAIYILFSFFRHLFIWFFKERKLYL